MADTKGIRAGRAFIEVFADDRALVRGLKSAKKHLSTFGSAVTGMGTKLMGLGGLVTAPLIAAAKGAADSGAALWDMSQRTGMSVEALSALSFAADMTGTSLEAAEKGIRIMQKSITGAADAAEGTTGKLDELKMTEAELAGLSPEKQFARIASALRDIKDPTERAAAAVKVFGRSGTALLPLIDNFDNLTQAAADMGFIKSTASAKAAKEFSVVLTLASKAAKSLGVALGTAVIPMLQQQAKRVTELTLMARNWIKHNSGLVVSVFKVAVGVTAAGAALVVFGRVIKGLAMGTGVLVTACKVLNFIFGLAGSAVAALFTPLGAIIGVALALGAIFLYASGAMGKAMDWLTQRFSDLASDARTAFGAVSKALAAGDIAAAAKVVWLTVKMEWQKGIGALLKFGNDFATGVRAAHELAVNWVTGLWLDCWYGLRSAWNEFQKWHERQVETWANWFAKIMIDMNSDLSPEQKEFAKNDIDHQSNQRFDQIKGERQAKKSQIESEQKLADEAAQKVHDDNMARIGAEGKAREDAIQGDIDAARAEWQKAISDVAAMPTLSGTGKGPGGMVDPARLLNGAKAALEGIANVIDKQEKFSARGTFNAAEMLSLQSSPNSAAERTAYASEQIARNTDVMAKKARTGGLTFA